MKIYLVGGAIRNRLLFLPVKEKDWVVVGSSLKEMISLGYKKVGKDFPVFIHPKSNEEYALARIEKKSGHGYTGFNCFFSSNVSLIEDLYRRDITINSIAEDKNGNLIDPFNGIKDLNKKIIRHVSNNFKDDPLRVLRVARFFSYLYHLNFKISYKTFNLMKLIVKSGELLYLSSERIFQEVKKAILTKNPECFFKILNKCGCLYIIFPEIFSLLNLKGKKIKNFYYIEEKIKKIKYLKLDYILRFSSLLYLITKLSINKFIINNNNLLKNKILIKKKIIISICNRLKLPNFFKNKFIYIIDNIYYIEKIEYINYINIVKLFYLLKINKNKIDLLFLIKLTFIHKNNKKIFIDLSNNKLYSKKEYLLKIWELINSVNIKNIINYGYIGKEIKNKIFNKQLEIVDEWTKNLKLIQK